VQSDHEQITYIAEEFGSQAHPHLSQDILKKTRHYPPLHKLGADALKGDSF